jgi:hypothetical protein
MSWKIWLLGLTAAVINGVASGIVLLLTGLASDPLSGQIEWMKLGTACVILGLFSAANYLKGSPLPRDVWTPAERANFVANGGGK